MRGRGRYVLWGLGGAFGLVWHSRERICSRRFTLAAMRAETIEGQVWKQTDQPAS